MENILIESAKGKLIALSFIQVASSVAFAFFFSGLSIFLVNNHLVTHREAALTTGLFLSLHYWLPLLGGALVDRLITCKNIFQLGIVFNIVGCVLLASEAYVYIALGCCLMNSLVKNICLNLFITELFNKNEIQKRRVAFVWNYLGMNVGCMLGYLLTGISDLTNNYQIIFLTVASLMFFTLIMSVKYLYESKSKSVVPFSDITQMTMTSILFIVLISVIVTFLHYAKTLYAFGTFLGCSAMIIIFITTYLRAKPHEKKGLQRFFFCSLCAIFFWFIYMLTPMIIMPLIKDNTVRTYGEVTLAPQWLMNIDSFFILAFVPMATVFLQKIKQGRLLALKLEDYFVTAFIMTIIALTIMSFSLFNINADFKFNLSQVIIYLLLVTLGEILVSPLGNAIVGECISTRLRSIAIGLWNMNIAIGSLVSSSFTQYTISQYLPLSSKYACAKLGYTFLVICLLSLVLISIILVTSGRLNLLKFRGVSDESKKCKADRATGKLSDEPIQ